MDLRLVGRSKIPSPFWGKGIANVQEFIHNIKIYKIGQDRIPTKSKAQNGYLVEGEGCILPTTQMKGASLCMKLLHWYRMPHGIRRNPQELLKSLLNQKAVIVHTCLRVEQVEKE